MHVPALSTLAAADPDLSMLIEAEGRRQHDKLRMIASENYVSRAVLEATGTVLTNKYSEGYPGTRYYEGQDFIDPIETLAITRAKELFGVDHANVQPYSGSPANLAIYLAFAQPGDTVMGMALPMGGHLTHGWPVSATGRWFRGVGYSVRRDTGRIDLDEVRDLARRERPKVIFCGGTAIPRTIDFEAFGLVAREVGAILAADISHIAGLIAGGVHPSPTSSADVISTTTHKTLRGPRGAMLMCRTEHAKRIDRAVFPGLQGGPHNHTTAGIAAALREAAQPSFRTYATRVVANAQALATALVERGFELVSGGTDTHLILIDLRNKGVAGAAAAKALDAAGIELNYNAVPYDTGTPRDPSGIRLGTAALTTRGLTGETMPLVAEWISQVIGTIGTPAGAEIRRAVAGEIKDLLSGYRMPGWETPRTES
jgi:glycine hydroxymethyltransferase